MSRIEAFGKCPGIVDQYVYRAEEVVSQRKELLNFIAGVEIGRQCICRAPGLPYAVHNCGCGILIGTIMHYDARAIGSERAGNDSANALATARYDNRRIYIGL